MKQITFTYENKDYILEYNRKTIKKMEEKGFSFAKLEDRLVSSLPDLFAGAFMLHHPNLSRDYIDTIFDKIGDKQNLFTTLGEMCAETVNTLFEEPSEGKIDWTMK